MQSTLPSTLLSPAQGSEKERSNSPLTLSIFGGSGVAATGGPIEELPMYLLKSVSVHDTKSRIYE